MGIMTERWGWQPGAWMQDGLPTWPWRQAPAGLVTRRQMRDLGLSPGGAQVIARIVCRRGRRVGYLYDPAECVPKKAASPAQRESLRTKTMAARRWCPKCERDVGYCIPTSRGACVDCAFPELADVA